MRNGENVMKNNETRGKGNGKTGNESDWEKKHKNIRKENNGGTERKNVIRNGGSNSSEYITATKKTDLKDERGIQKAHSEKRPQNNFVGSRSPSRRKRAPLRMKKEGGEFSSQGRRDTTVKEEV